MCIVWGWAFSCGHESRPWVRRPNWQNLGLAAQTGPKGALTRAPSGHPRFLTARYRSLAIFQRLRLVPQTPPLRGTLISDSNLLEKKLSLFLITHSTSF